LFFAISLYAQSKTTRSRVVWNFSYAEFNDGCLVISGRSHWIRGNYLGVIGGGFIQTSAPRHRNDNVVVRTEINRFNSEIRRLEAVPYNDQQAIFDRTPIGSWYFVYRVDQIYVTGAGAPTTGPGGVSRLTQETALMTILTIWRVDVVQLNQSRGQNRATQENQAGSGFSSIIGYNWAYGRPGGFTVGGNNFFSSWNFGGGFEWTVGYAIPTFDFMQIALGAGGNHDQAGDDWNHAFMAEAGLLFNFATFYLLSTYRFKWGNRHSFTIGAGFVF